MLSNYLDIRKRIAEEPTWYDQNGCPRYGKFHPDLSPNIYAKVVTLTRIKCQSCGKEFLVEMSICDFFWLMHNVWHQPRKWVYGDPPRHDDSGQRCAGETMSCDEIEVIRAWRRGDGEDRWVRVKKWEGKML